MVEVLLSRIDWRRLKGSFSEHYHRTWSFLGVYHLVLDFCLASCSLSPYRTLPQWTAQQAIHQRAFVRFRSGPPCLHQFQCLRGRRSARSNDRWSLYRLLRVYRFSNEFDVCFSFLDHTLHAMSKPVWLSMVSCQSSSNTTVAWNRAVNLHQLSLGYMRRFYSLLLLKISNIVVRSWYGFAQMENSSTWDV